jgi:hypothetical protein
VRAALGAQTGFYDAEHDAVDEMQMLLMGGGQGTSPRSIGNVSPGMPQADPSWINLTADVPNNHTPDGRKVMGVLEYQGTRLIAVTTQPDPQIEIGKHLSIDKFLESLEDPLRSLYNSPPSREQISLGSWGVLKFELAVRSSVSMGLEQGATTALGGSKPSRWG